MIDGESEKSKVQGDSWINTFFAVGCYWFCGLQMSGNALTLFTLRADVQKTVGGGVQLLAPQAICPCILSQVFSCVCHPLDSCSLRFTLCQVLCWNHRGD